MVYKSHLIRATLDALDFLEIFQEPWLDFLYVKKSHFKIIDGYKNINSWYLLHHYWKIVGYILLLTNPGLYGIPANLFMSEHLWLAGGVYVYGLRHVLN